MALVNTLRWRYATKKFDTEKNVSEEHITDLLRGMNLAPSSLGLQPYEFIVINNQQLQDQLVEYSYGQEKISQASHVMVIAAQKTIDDKYIHKYINTVAVDRGVAIESLDEYKHMIKGFVSGKTDAEILQWSQKQCYIVLGVLMSLCADMHIDACPMEGFLPEKYNELLDLDTKGLMATLVIPLGYRADDDEYAQLKKVRKSLEHIVQLHY